jgi:transcription elongation factor Elf1
MAWEDGDVCPVCSKRRRYKANMDSKGFLVGTFELCVCGLPCQTEHAKGLYEITAYPRKLKEN